MITSSVSGFWEVSYSCFPECRHYACAEFEVIIASAQGYGPVIPSPASRWHVFLLRTLICGMKTTFYNLVIIFSDPDNRRFREDT